MYLAMNRFTVSADRAAEFEEIWAKRESYLDEVPGFVSFHLLRGPEGEGSVLYASHTVWESAAAFEAWTKSEAFVKAHSQGRMPEGVLAGHPKLESFESVLER